MCQFFSDGHRLRRMGSRLLTCSVSCYLLGSLLVAVSARQCPLDLTKLRQRSAHISTGDSFLGDAGPQGAATDAALAAAVEEGTHLFLDQVCSGACLAVGWLPARERWECLAMYYVLTVTGLHRRQCPPMIGLEALQRC
jgi:hypothetical protein